MVYDYTFFIYFKKSALEHVLFIKEAFNWELLFDF